MPVLAKRNRKRNVDNVLDLQYEADQAAIREALAPKPSRKKPPVLPSTFSSQYSKNGGALPSSDDEEKPASGVPIPMPHDAGQSHIASDVPDPDTYQPQQATPDEPKLPEDLYETLPGYSERAQAANADDVAVTAKASDAFPVQNDNLLLWSEQPRSRDGVRLPPSADLRLASKAFNKHMQLAAIRSQSRLDSFTLQVVEYLDYMMRHIFPALVQEKAETQIAVTSVKREVVIRLKNLVISRPQIISPRGRVEEMTPLDAMVMNTTYGVRISVDVIAEEYDLVMDEATEAASRQRWKEAAEKEHTEAEEAAERLEEFKKKHTRRGRPRTYKPSEAKYQEWHPQASEYKRVPSSRPTVICRQFPLVESFPIPVGSKLGVHNRSSVRSRFNGLPQPIGILIKSGVERTSQGERKPATCRNMITETKTPGATSKTCKIYRSELRSIRNDENTPRSTSNLNLYLRVQKTKMEVKGEYLRITIPFIKTSPSLFALLRILGVKTVDEVIACTWPNPETRPPEGVAILRAVMDPALEALTEDDLLEMFGSATSANPTRQARVTQARLQIKSETLPRIGNDFSPTTNMLKAVYIMQVMLRGLIECALGKRPLDMRNFEGNKFVEMAYMNLGNMFRQLLKDQFTDPVRDKTRKILLSGKPFNLDTVLKNNRVSYQVAQSFAKGQTVVIKQRSNTSTTMVQLPRVNIQMAEANLMRLVKPAPKKLRTADMRTVNMGEAGGLVCPTASPEGAPVGLVNNAASLAHVRRGTNTEIIIEHLKDFVLAEACLKGTPWEAATLHPITSISDAIALLKKNVNVRLVTVNSAVAGIVTSPIAALQALRQARRVGVLPVYCSIYLKHNEVIVNTDPGTLMAPYLVLDRAYLLRDAVLESQVYDLEMWGLLLQRGCVEYLCANEAYCSYIASDLHDAYDNAFAFENGFTDCQKTHAMVVPWQIFGCSASVIPFPGFNQSPRNTYQTGMGKQAMGITSDYIGKRTLAPMNHPYTHEAQYLQKPACVTMATHVQRTLDMTPGLNTFMYMRNDCYTQEDALHVNRAALERGWGRITYNRVVFWYEKQAQSKHDPVEHIGNPLEPIIVNGKQYNYPVVGLQARRRYGKIDSSGLPMMGVPIRNREIICGKTQICTRNNQETGEPETYRRDCSLPMQCPDSEIGIVTSVLVFNKEGSRCVKIQITFHRGTQQGDKFSTRHGQKGTVGMVSNQEDLDFVIDGPERMLGTTATVTAPVLGWTRMTCAQLLEGICSLIAFERGHEIDATPFQRVDVREILKTFMRTTKSDYKATLASGKYGVPLRGKVFAAFMVVQRLKQMVLDKSYACAAAPRNRTTGQPIAGRQKGGGLRFGEMETFAMEQNGASKSLHERMCGVSDRFVLPVCPSCLQIAETHHDDYAEMAKAAGLDVEEDPENGESPFLSDKQVAALRKKDPTLPHLKENMKFTGYICRICNERGIKKIVSVKSYANLVQNLGLANIGIRHSLE